MYGLTAPSVAVDAAGNPKGNLKLFMRQIIQKTFTLNTGIQDEEQVIPALGDVAALALEITVIATGTLTTPNKLSSALNAIRVLDPSNQPIVDTIAGTDLKYFDKYFSPKGTAPTETDVSTSSATDTLMLPLSIDRKHLPARIKISAAAYSALAASGATGGTLTVRVMAYYRDGHTNTTDRIKKKTLATIAAENSFAPFLSKGRILRGIIFTYTAAYFTDVKISRDGSDELKLNDNQLAAIERQRFISAKTSGVAYVEPSPFVVSDATEVVWTSSTADTVNMLLVEADIAK